VECRECRMKTAMGYVEVGEWGLASDAGKKNLANPNLFLGWLGARREGDF